MDGTKSSGAPVTPVPENVQGGVTVEQNLNEWRPLDTARKPLSAEYRKIMEKLNAAEERRKIANQQKVDKAKRGQAHHRRQSKPRKEDE